MRLSRLFALALLLVTLTFPLRADFNEVVHAISASGGAHRIYIPFLSVARFFTHVVEPNGVSDLHLAVFEKREDRTPDLDALVHRSLSPDWSPVVRSHERGGDDAVIYMRPAKGSRLDILIVASEQDGEITVVQARVTEEGMKKMIEDRD